MSAVRRGSLFTVLFLTTLALLFAMAVVAGRFGYDTVSSVNMSGLDYDGRAHDQPLFSEKRLFEPKTAAAKSIEIGFAMKAAPSGSAYRDLFQTAPFNQGLRLELSSSGTLVLVAATDQPPGWKLYLISTTIGTDEWHRFDLTIDPTNRIVIRFDGKQIVDAPDSELHYDISDLVLGSSDSFKRPFAGTIHGASIRYSLYDVNPVTSSLYFRILEAVLLIANLVFLFLLSGRRDAGSLRSDRVPVDGV